MQEHIKKMAVEAGAVFDALAMGRHDGVLFTPAELERFAQSVARECAEICDAERAEFQEQAAQNNGRKSDMAFGSLNSSERIMVAIRARFGLGE